MKSIFLTFLIFAGVFLFAGSGILSVIGENWFRYTTYSAFVIVMLAGIYVTLLRKPTAGKNEGTNQIQEEKPQIEQKEGKNDEK